MAPVRFLFILLLVVSILPAWSGTSYPIPPDRQATNRRQVETSAAAGYSKGKPLVACVIEALSGTRRTPDLFPEDGDFVSPLRFLAARGEFEPASFLLFAFEDLADVRLSASDLVAKDGARIPSSAIDLTVVKVWYQSGLAWHGYHADDLRRIPVPELLLHDEKLVLVDHGRRENFVRADYASGKSDYRWNSFLGLSSGFKNHLVRYRWLHDAETLRPVTLQKNAFKQFFATFHAPASAAAGFYHGEISVTIGGKKAFSIPVTARVLPFELPAPSAFRDLDRPFFGAFYLGSGYMDVSTTPKLAKNLADHNARNLLLPSASSERVADDFRAVLPASGMNTNVMFSVLPPADLRTSWPPDPEDKDYGKFKSRVGEISNAVVRLRKRFGDQVVPYAYGIDEGGPKTVRAERAIWQATQAAGGKTLVATRPHYLQLFGLDAAVWPKAPSPRDTKDVDSFHDANPDMLIGWYGGPHTGPENPDFSRRLYGWRTWRGGYDFFGQAELFRDDWNEFYIPNEPNLRGLMLCYPQDRDVIDTLAWEGVREAVDDIRYATLLRQIARKVLETSCDMEAVYAARAAMTWVAQVDCERSSLSYLRHEMISRILDLQARLGKEGK